MLRRSGTASRSCKISSIITAAEAAAFASFEVFSSVILEAAAEDRLPDVGNFADDGTGGNAGCSDVLSSSLCGLGSEFFLAGLGSSLDTTAVATAFGSEGRRPDRGGDSALGGGAPGAAGIVAIKIGSCAGVTDSRGVVLLGVVAADDVPLGVLVADEAIAPRGVVVVEPPGVDAVDPDPLPDEEMAELVGPEDRVFWTGWRMVDDWTAS
jgi:hypothetical protein